MEDLKQQYLDELKRLSNLEYRDEVKIAELTENFNGMSIEIRKKEKLLQRKQWAYLSTHPSKHLLLSAMMMMMRIILLLSQLMNLEFEGIPEHVYDVPSHNNSPPLDVSNDQIKDFSESNEEFSLIDDDSFSIDTIDYVEASPLDSELVSSEVMEIVIPEVEPNSRDFTMDVVKDISLTKEPQVLNALPTHPTLQLNMKFQPSSEYLFTYVIWIFLPFHVYSVVPHYLLSLRNEDTIFDPGICMSTFSRPDISHRSNSLKDNIIYGLPPCSEITPNEPVDSLSMGDEHLNTIPATESDKFIKSSVENLIPNPSESEGESECDMPACEAFTTFSNVLFDADYDFYSVDDQSLSDEDFSKEIYSNPLFDEEIIPMKIHPHSFNAESDLIESMLNHDSSIIISSKIDSLFDEFAGELTLLKSIPSGIEETDCHHEEETHFTKRLLYENSSPCPPEEFVYDNSDADIESFSPSPILIKDSDSHLEKIDLPFTPDDPMPPGINEDDYDSERDIPIFEELLDNYSLSLPENESYHFDIPSSSRPPAKPPDGNTGILNIKMMGDVSEQKVPMPRLTITCISNQEKSPDLLSHQGLEIFQPSAECPMIINGKNTPILDDPLFHFYPH
nr:hypothetical protein [Tanacetum cinerariifolium]